jgi:pectate lyase
MRATRRRGLIAGAAAAVVLTVASVAVSVTTAHAATLFGDDFETGTASGWSKSGGSWSVVTDGSRVYRQSSTGSDAKAQAGQLAWTNQTVQARVKPSAFNGQGRFAGVLARAQNMTTYYYLGLRNDGQVVLGRRAGGYTTLAAAPAAVATGSWYTLRLEAFGSTLRGYLDGQQVVTASDGALAAGRVGLAGYYASASFDDVQVADQAGPAPTPTASPSPTTSPSQPPPPPPPPGQPDGYASVNALGQNGTTGGAGGPTVTVTTGAELAQYAGANTPYIIMVSGQVQVSGMVTVVANKSIIGIGSNAGITGGGLQLGTTTRPGNNVIIRNLSFRNADDDSVSVHNASHHVWIDHNEFYPAFDGSVDVKRRSTYVTVSWNWFRGTDKSMLLGHSDSFTEDIGHLKVTYHHNYFDGSNQRHPRVRFGEPVHVYNNYYRDIGLYGIVSVENAGVMVEGNYFEGVAFPCYSASGYADSDPGRLVQRNNVFTGSGTCETNGSVAEPSTFYSYTMDSAAAVPQIVTAGVGVGTI